jgi:hypothetical protein
MNKRDFIAGAGVGALAAACGPVLAADVPRSVAAAATPAARWPDRPVPLEGQQSRAAWQQYLGHHFELPSGALCLVAVEDSQQASGALEQFRLVFESSTALTLEGDKVHTLRHGTGQRLPLWLQAAGSGRWQANFSLLA